MVQVLHQPETADENAPPSPGTSLVEDLAPRAGWKSYNYIRPRAEPYYHAFFESVLFSRGVADLLLAVTQRPRKPERPGNSVYIALVWRIRI